MSTDSASRISRSDSQSSRSRSRRSRLNPLSHGLVWGYAALMVIPLYFLVVSSFKTNSAIFASPFGLPSEFSFENFVTAWEWVDLGNGLLNSVLITVGAEILTIVLAVCAAYGIARASGRIGRAVERFFSLGLLIPTFAALVPTVLLAIALGMFHNRVFLIMYLAASALPLSVILLTQFMRAVPAELEESAMLDGAGRLRVLWSVYVPIAIPGIAAVAIINFLAFWNEYLFSLILLGPSPETRTAQIALPTVISSVRTDYGVLLAGAVITMIPVYVMYLILQRRLEEALVHGATKG